MKLTILGSGSFISDLGHWGPGYLLEIGKKKILIDAGSGVQIQLLKLGIKLEDLDYIFITHFHTDHTTDLTSIHMRYRNLAKKFKPNYSKKLQIIGPSNIEKFIQNLYRISGLGNKYDPKTAICKNAFTKIKFSDFRFETFKTKHMENVESCIYRFENVGKSVVFSGDTIKCSGIETACKNADLLIADCSISKNQTNVVHWNTYEIGEVCQKQKVKKVILSHLMPKGLKYDLVSEVKEKFDGEVILAEDLMQIKL
ncbi:MAG: ribonuclease Z [bacterium]